MGMSRMDTIRVKVMLFALYRELTGEKEVHLELPRGAKVADMLRVLEERYPKLKGRFIERSEEHGRSFILMKGGRWPDPNEKLEDGEEFALFPPVGGGRSLGLANLDIMPRQSHLE